MPKITIGLRDGSKFWVGITGLKNPIRDTLRLEAMIEAMVILMYQGHQTNRKSLSRIKIKHFPRRTGKRKYLSTSSRYNIFP